MWTEAEKLVLRCGAWFAAAVVCQLTAVAIVVYEVFGHAPARPALLMLAIGLGHAGATWCSNEAGACLGLARASFPKPDYDQIARLERDCDIGQPVPEYDIYNQETLATIVDVETSRLRYKRLIEPGYTYLKDSYDRYTH